ALLFTIAIVSHHFTAMGAMTLVADPTIAFQGTQVSPTMLSFFVAGCAFTILGVALSVSSMDRRAKVALRAQRVLLDTALENMSQGLCMFDACGRIVLFNERTVSLMGPAITRFKDRSLLELLRDMKASGRWDGDPDSFFAKLLA